MSDYGKLSVVGTRVVAKLTVLRNDDLTYTEDYAKIYE